MSSARPDPRLWTARGVGGGRGAASAHGGGRAAQAGRAATRAQLVAATSRREVDEALRTGRITVLARGRFALPSADAAVIAAHRLSGVLTLESAAVRHGWAVKTVEGPPHVAVPRNRRIRAGQATGVVIHYRDLGLDDVDGDVTSREATLLHCLRELSFDAALAVADSALRDGEQAMLRRVAVTVRGAGAAQVRRRPSLRRPGRGRLVLRFAWEDVMFDQEWVVEVIRNAVTLRLWAAIARAS